MKKRTKRILKGAALLGGGAALAGGGYAAYKRQQAKNKPYAPGKKVTVAPSPETLAGSAAGRKAKAAYKRSKDYKKARATSVAISSKSPYVSSSNTRSSAAKSAGVKKAYSKMKAWRVKGTRKQVSGFIDRRDNVRKSMAADKQNRMMAKTMYAINQVRRQAK